MSVVLPLADKLIAELNEYRYILFKTKQGEEGRKYIQERNILPSTAIKWKLGYCPKNYVPKCYEEYAKSDVYPFWKKMQGRIVIPVFDQNNKLVALSGRAIFPNMKPKYHHYNVSTSKLLFGLGINKEDIREENRAIITEGQFDVISAWQKGIKTVVSSFGAHGSQEQFALLGRYTNNIYIVYDADAAGEKGTVNLESINKSDLNVRFCKNVFPEGTDLDEWVQTHSKEEFYAALDNNRYYRTKNKIYEMLHREVITAEELEVHANEQKEIDKEIEDEFKSLEQIKKEKRKRNK